MMDETPELTEPQREDVAFRLLQQERSRGRLPNYRPLARNLPLLLRQHGLGQTLAYLQGRAAERTDTPFKLLYDHLASWLQERLGLPPGDILTTLAGVDSRVYLLASEEATEFALALRRALAEIQASEGATGRPDPAKEVE